MLDADGVVTSYAGCVGRVQGSLESYDRGLITVDRLVERLREALDELERLQKKGN